MSDLVAAQTPQLKLRDGTTIPQLGLGLWQVDPANTDAVVSHAIEAGYRLIDTAEGYDNEQGVGAAIRRATVPREQLYITSKLRNGGHKRDVALQSFDESMEKLGIDQLDLFLIHWPVPSQDNYVEAWKTLIELREQGRVRAIGVSNFNADHLERIIGETGVVPVVNQIELHPRFQQRPIRKVLAEHDIKPQSWSPLGSGKLLNGTAFDTIAAKHGKSVAQVIIRWHLQEGLIVIPKSIHQERIAQNIAVFDFNLDDEDMRQINSLDQGEQGRAGPQPEREANLF